MIALLVGLVIGFLMCIPIGPINVWVINTQIKGSSARALAVAFGGSVMDFCYFYLILTGLSLLSLSDTTIYYSKFLGIIFIFAMGLREIVYPSKPKNADGFRETPKGILRGLVLGVVLYVSNPALVVTMSGLGTFVKSLNLFLFTQLNIIAVSLGLSLGSFLWFAFLIKFVERYQETIRQRYLTHFTRISGAMMVALSFFMGQRFYFLEILK